MLDAFARNTFEFDDGNAMKLKRYLFLFAVLNHCDEAAKIFWQNRKTASCIIRNCNDISAIARLKVMLAWAIFRSAVVFVCVWGRARVSGHDLALSPLQKIVRSCYAAVLL